MTLVVTNAYGKDSTVKKSYIKVLRELLLPIVETIEVFDVSGLTLKAGGSLIDTGSAFVTEKGLCWDTITKPSISSFHSKASDVELGDYIIQMKELKENTTYYYRAYAVNADGIGYGKEYSIKTTRIDTCDFLEDKFQDKRDKKVYRKIDVGGKTWMGDNLNFETPNSWNYNNLETNGDKYGKLYSIEAAKAACPEGWRLPTDSEWNSLINSLGKDPAFKMMNKSGWDRDPGFNTICFSAMPGGYKSLKTEVFSTLRFFGYWWTASKNADDRFISKNISYDNNSVLTIGYDNDIALSVRCIKD